EGLYVNAGGDNPGLHLLEVGRRLDAYQITGWSWITIDGFTVLHTEDKGIAVSGGSNFVTVTHCTVRFSFKQGIQFSGGTNCFIGSNVSYDNADHGMAFVSGFNSGTIQDNESYRNAQPNVRASNGIYMYGAVGNLILRNRLHDNQDSGMHMQT